MNSSRNTVPKVVGQVYHNLYILEEGNGDFLWLEDGVAWKMFAHTENTLEGGASEEDEKNVRHTCTDVSPQPVSNTSGFTPCKRCKHTMMTLNKEYFANIFLANLCNKMNSLRITVTTVVAHVYHNLYILEEEDGDFLWWEDGFAWKMFPDNTENTFEGGVSEEDEKNMKHTCTDVNPQPGPMTSGFTPCKRCKHNMKTANKEFFARITKKMK